MRKNKNRSKKIKDGTILQTRDNHLWSGRNYSGKSNSKKNNKLDRPVTVVASNRSDDLAVIKITHSPKGTKLKDGVRGHSSGFKPFVETLDNTGSRIKQGAKFQPTKDKLTKMDLLIVNKLVFKKSRQARENRRRVRTLKKRKKRN
jgi:hypothetical protein